MHQTEIDKIIAEHKLHEMKEDSRVRPESAPPALYDIFPKENRHDIRVYVNDAQNTWLYVDKKTNQIVLYSR